MSILLLRRPAKGSGIVAAGLQLYYAFDEGSGQSLADQSGGGNDGTLGSSAGADTNDPSWTSSGLSFTVDDFVDCGGAAALRPDAWTVSAVMKLSVDVVSPVLGWHSSAQFPGVFPAAPFNARRPLIWLSGTQSRTATIPPAFRRT